jgi:DNA invertase Pin-like site-specific DNA recombinase
MVNALVIHRSHVPKAQRANRAAQYVRMSTDRQKYSIQNQAAVIAAYAHAHRLEIVRTYADEGESGLRIRNRTGLQDLLRDVAAGNAGFDHILVYDVSRWGRFQDTDESAHYEFVCRKAGVKVAYCAEQFDNDGSMLSSIIKNLKRVMAAEYSRELSVKIHAGQSRVASMGFRPGAPLGYGLLRELVDENRQPKAILESGMHKWLSTDRVRVRPGGPDQVAVIRWIFRQCLERQSDCEIARKLNQRKVQTADGRSWNSARVNRILQNEMYVGNMIYNRGSRKLGAKRTENPPELWVRAEGCIDAIIDQKTFLRAKKIIEERRVQITEDEMLSRLRRVLHKKGRLSPSIIAAAKEVPCVHTFVRHFGTLRNAYRLVGYEFTRDYRFVDAKARWTAVIEKLSSQVAAEVRERGGEATVGPSKDSLSVEGKLNVLFRVARAYPKEGNLTQWRIPRLGRLPSGWMVVARLTDDNAAILDYVLMPINDVLKRYSKCMRITERARSRYGFDRFDSPNALVHCLIYRKLRLGEQTRRTKRTTTSKVSAAGSKTPGLLNRPGFAGGSNS